MRRLALILLVGMAVVLQMSLLPGLRPFGVVPNLVLVVIVLASLYVVTSEALAAAAMSGLILDLVSNVNFGLWTGVLMLTVIVVGLMRRSGIELDGLMMAVGLVSAATIVIALVIWATFIGKAANLAFSDVAGRLLIELVINLGLMMVLMVPIRWLLRGGRTPVDMGA